MYLSFSTQPIRRLFFIRYIYVCQQILNFLAVKKKLDEIFAFHHLKSVYSVENASIDGGCHGISA